MGPQATIRAGGPRRGADGARASVGAPAGAAAFRECHATRRALRVTGYPSMAEAKMNDPVDALVVDLLEWIGPAPRPYAEVLDAWRTSCPRLPVWEEANARGFLVHGRVEGMGAVVAVSEPGMAHLNQARSEFPGRNAA